MKWFRRNKAAGEEDSEFDEDLDFGDLDEEVEDEIGGQSAAPANGDSVPAPTPETSSAESGTEPSANGSRRADVSPDPDGNDEEDIDFGDEFDEGVDLGEDEYDEDGEDRFAGLKAKLAPLMANKWGRIGGYVGSTVVVLGLLGGGAMLLFGGEDELAQKKQADDSVYSGGLQPPTGGGLNESAAVEGETISAERASAGISAFSTVGGLNAAVGESMEGGGIIVPVASSSAYSRYPDREQGDPLSKAPNADLLEFRGETVMPLPRTADDGRVSWQEYARPYEIEPGIARVGIIITGMGLSKAATLASIRKLPAEVTLSFSPYAEELDQWMIRSRRAGHEVMLGLSLETSRFPIEDHGPLALKVDLPVEENMLLLEDTIMLLQGSIGVEVMMGSRFTSNAGKVRDLLNMLSSRGLMIVDHKGNVLSKIPVVAAETGMPYTVSEVRLDEVMAVSAINARLKEAERLIKKNNKVIVTTSMTPAIMGRLQLWFASLHAMGIVLAPVSSFVSLEGEAG